MNDDPEDRTAAAGAGADDPLERRLAALLAELRAGPEPDEALIERVIRTARWQHAIRGAVRAVGDLVGAVVDALELRARRRGGDDAGGAP